MSKQRVTITADSESLTAAHQAVFAGQYASVSEWANAALIEKAARDGRMRELRAALATYEGAHGVITEEEIAEQRRSDRDSAIVVRPRRRARAR